MNDFHERVELFELFFKTTETAKIYDYDSLPLYARESLIESIVVEIVCDLAGSDLAFVEERLSDAITGIYLRNRDRYKGTELEKFLEGNCAGYLESSNHEVTDLVEVWINALDQIHLYLLKQDISKDELTLSDYVEKIRLYLCFCQARKVQENNLEGMIGMALDIVVEIDDDALLEYLQNKDDGHLYGITDYLTEGDAKDWFEKRWDFIDDPQLLKRIYFR